MEDQRTIGLKEIIIKLKQESIKSYFLAQQKSTTTIGFVKAEEVFSFLKNDKKILLALSKDSSLISIYFKHFASQLWEQEHLSNAIPLCIELSQLKDPFAHLVEEGLSLYGLTEEQQQGLCKSNSAFVLILMGYDELKTDRPRNLYVTNKLEKFNIKKVIITCHSDYIETKKNYRLLFASYQNKEPQYDKFQEINLDKIELTSLIKKEELEIKSADSGFWHKILTDNLDQLFIGSQMAGYKQPPTLKELQVHPLNTRLLVEIPTELNTRAESILQVDYNPKKSENFKFKQLCFLFLRYSKYSHLVETGAANAITILNVAKASFSGMDLSQIKIPDADLSGAILHFTILDSSNLQRVNLRDAFLAYTTFNKSVVTGIFFDEDRILQHKDEVYSIAYSHDGYWLATACGNSIYIWNINGDFIKQTTLNEHSKNINNIVFSADGKYIVSGSDDKTIKVWHLDTLLCDQTLIGHTGPISSVKFTSDQKFIVSSSRDRSIRLWEVKTGKCVKIWLGHEKTINSVVVTPDGEKILSASLDGTIRLWSFDSEKCIKIWQAHKNGVCSIAISPDGNWIVSGGHDKAVRFWNINNKGCFKTLIEHQASVNTVAFSNDGLLMVSGSSDKSVRLWNVNSDKSIQTWKAHSEDVLSVVFLSNKKLASGSADKTVKFLEIRNAKSISTYIREPIIYSYCFATSPTYEHIALGNGKLIQILETKTNNCIQILEGHNDFIICLAFSPDGYQIGSGGSDCIACIWQIGKKEAIRILKHSFPIDSIDFSPDGKQVITSSRYLLKIWEIDSGECLQSWPWCMRMEFSLAIFSPIKKIIASVFEENIQIWKNSKNMCYQIWSLKAHSEKILAITFSNNGHFIASGGNDKLIKIWRVFDNSPLKILTSHKKAVNSVFFSKDSRWLASGSDDKNVFIWDTYYGHILYALNHPKKILTVKFGRDEKTLLVHTKFGLYIWQLKNERWLLQWTNNNILVINNIDISCSIGLSEANKLFFKEREATKEKSDYFILKKYSYDSKLSSEISGMNEYVVNVDSFCPSIEMFSFSYPVTIKRINKKIEVSLFYDKDSFSLSLPDISKILHKFNEKISKWENINTVNIFDNLISIEAKEGYSEIDLEKSLRLGISLFNNKYSFFFIDKIKINFFFNVRKNLSEIQFPKKFIKLLISMMGNDQMAFFKTKFDEGKKQYPESVFASREYNRELFTDILESQLRWNCFDIAVNLKRNELVEYALKNADQEEFRQLLAPEILHAAALTAVNMNLQDEHEKEISKRICELFEIATVLEKEDETQIFVSQEVEELLKDKMILSGLIHHALPKIMHTDEIKKIVNNYTEAHEKMRYAVAICNKHLGHEEGKYLSLEELINFFQKKENCLQNYKAYEEFTLAHEKIFSEYEKALHTYCMNIGIYKEYVTNYYGKQGWFAFQQRFNEEKPCTSMIDIAAKYLQKQIIIYQKIKGNLKEIYRTSVYEQGIVEVEYNGHDHFVKREIIDASIVPSGEKKIESSTSILTSSFWKPEKFSLKDFLDKAQIVGDYENTNMVAIVFSDLKIAKGFQEELFKRKIVNLRMPAHPRKIELKEIINDQSFTIRLTADEYNNLMGNNKAYQELVAIDKSSFSV